MSQQEDDTLRDAEEDRERFDAALAPSPAQPTEASDDAFTAWVKEIESGGRPYWKVANHRAAFDAGWDARTPSPVQGADDRLAQADPESDLFNVTGKLMEAEAVIADIQYLWRTSRVAEVFHLQAGRVLKKYRANAQTGE